LIKHGGTTAVHRLRHRSIGDRPSVSSGDGPAVCRGASVRFGQAEPIAVDIVSPAESRRRRRRRTGAKAQPSDAFDLSSKSAASSSLPPAAVPEQQRRRNSRRRCRRRFQTANRPTSSRSRHQRLRRPATPLRSLIFPSSITCCLGSPSIYPEPAAGQAGDPFDAPASRPPSCTQPGDGVSTSSEDTARSCRHRSPPPTRSRSSCGCS